MHEKLDYKNAQENPLVEPDQSKQKLKVSFLLPPKSNRWPVVEPPRHSLLVNLKVNDSSRSGSEFRKENLGLKSSSSVEHPGCGSKMSRFLFIAVYLGRAVGSFLGRQVRLKKWFSSSKGSLCRKVHCKSDKGTGVLSSFM